MAGLLAEEKLFGRPWPFEKDVIKQLQEVRAGRNEHFNECPSDLRSIALSILDDDPGISLGGARRVVTYFRTRTAILLSEPRIWSGIERFAKELVRRRYLSPRSVQQVLGEPFLRGCRPDTAAQILVSQNAPSKPPRAGYAIKV